MMSGWWAQGQHHSIAARQTRSWPARFDGQSRLAIGPLEWVSVSPCLYSAWHLAQIDRSKVGAKGDARSGRATWLRHYHQIVFMAATVHERNGRHMATADL